jgi:hypothetical protein
VFDRKKTMPVVSFVLKLSILANSSVVFQCQRGLRGRMKRPVMESVTSHFAMVPF